MGTRGRVSAASMEIAGAQTVQKVQRPDAPYDLTDEQTDEWWAVVNRLPADWFPRETHGLLAQYCRHVVAARRVASLITAMEKAGGDLNIADYDRLMKMQEREGRAMSSLASRMRINQQSTRSDKTKKPLQMERPWE
mgnify:CR=1 FL=1